MAQGALPRRARRGGDRARPLARHADRFPRRHCAGRAALRHPARHLPAPGAGDADHPQHPDQTALPIRTMGSFLPGNGVGGAGVHWNGQTWRFLPWRLQGRAARLTERYGADFLPPENHRSRTGASPTRSSSPTTTGSSSSAASRARPATCKGEIQPGGNPFEGAAAARLSDAADAPGPGADAVRQGRGGARAASLSRPSANLSQAYTNPLGMQHGALHLLRLLRALRLRQLLQGQPADLRAAGADAPAELRGAAPIAR